MVSLLTYMRENWDTLGPEILTHIEIVAIAMAAATLIGLAVGVVAARDGRVAAVALTVTSVIITIPSFALFGLLTIWFRLGNTPVILGLILYALLPIVRNTYTGLRGVDASVVEAARGMGMRAHQYLVRVELPLAAPVILAGVRQATVMVVAIATVGAAVGADDLGRPILAAVGRTSGSYERLLAGVLPVALIGIAADGALALVQRLLMRGRTRSRRRGGAALAA